MVELYKNKKFAEAKKKFEELSQVIPDSTMKYLARKRAAQEQQKVLQEQRWKEEVERIKQEVQRQHELEARERQQMIDLQERAGVLYKSAIDLFHKKNMDEALEKFNDIEKLLPGFKSTRIYIVRIEQWKIDQQKLQIEAQEENLRQKKIADERRQAQEFKDKLEAQQKQARDIADLAEKEELERQKHSLIL